MATQAVDSKGESVVLMARIVDAEGSSVRPGDLAAIEYSIYELDPERPQCQRAVDGHENVAVNVDEAFYDTPRCDGRWALDDVGYNFRHDIALEVARSFREVGAHYQVRYELTSACGRKTIVRFVFRRCNELVNHGDTKDTKDTKKNKRSNR